MSAQKKPIGYVLVLGLSFLGLINKIYIKDLISAFINHWFNLAWTRSLNPCQCQGLYLDLKIHSRQIIFIVVRKLNWNDIFGKCFKTHHVTGGVTNIHVIFVIVPCWLIKLLVFSITFPCWVPWVFCTRVRSWVSVICRICCRLSTIGFLHRLPKQNSYHIQASFTRGVLIMSSRNISSRIFEIDNFLLVLVIVWVFPAATRVPPPTFIAKIVSSIINQFLSRGLHFQVSCTSKKYYIHIWRLLCCYRWN